MKFLKIEFGYLQFMTIGVDILYSYALKLRSGEYERFAGKRDGEV